MVQTYNGIKTASICQQISIKTDIFCLINCSCTWYTDTLEYKNIMHHSSNGTGTAGSLGVYLSDWSYWDVRSAVLKPDLENGIKTIICPSLKNKRHTESGFPNVKKCTSTRKKGTSVGLCYKNTSMWTRIL